MTDFAESKLDFIREISAIEDEIVLRSVVNYYKTLQQSRTDLRKKYAKPVRKRLDPNALKRAQNFTGHNHAEIMSILQNIDIPESIETLTAQLTA